MVKDPPPAPASAPAPAPLPPPFFFLRNMEVGRSAESTRSSKRRRTTTPARLPLPVTPPPAQPAARQVMPARMDPRRNLARMVLRLGIGGTIGGRPPPPRLALVLPRMASGEDDAVTLDTTGLAAKFCPGKSGVPPWGGAT